MITKLIIPLFCVTICSVSMASGVSTGFENEDVGDTMPISSTSGWSQVLLDEGGAPAGSAIIQEDGDGFDKSQYLSLLNRQTYLFYEDEAPIWTDSDDAFTFKVDFRFDGEMPIDFILHNGRTTAGFYIMIDSQKKVASLSQGGGVSVHRGDRKTFPLDGLKLGHWYTLEVRHVVLSDYDSVVGELYLYDREMPAKVLLEGVDVISSGSIPFSKLGTVQVRRWGCDGENFDVDNFQLKAD